ncbi:cilia- and flagella-associated protein HOATZ [Tiliqua scincoides]|uniref:cilia- and flagella-associated protein HOATZ n=1 Tax=Tiliqua scincoides TaxID=71010 RepID=UPI003461DAF4
METRPGPAAGPAPPGAPPAPPPSSSRESPGAGGGAGWPGALVFAGSAERDVALAKSFWSSVTLQPPLESRLGPRADSRSAAAAASSVCAALLLSSQSCALRRSHLQLLEKGSFLSQASFIDKKEEKTQNPLEPNTSDEKGQYLQKAKKREEIIALLRKQREERIMKEMISQRHKPKTRPQQSKVKTSESDLEDQESVKALT